MSFRILVAVTLIHTVCACSPMPKSPEVSALAEVDQSPRLQIIPEQIDCGVVSQCELRSPIEVVLRNATAETVRVRGFVATCGCTIPNLRPNTEIAPGEEVAVKIRLELWGQGRKQQFVRFIDENFQPLGRVQVRYEVRSPLRTTPSGIARDVNPDGSFQLESFDETSFSIRDSYPPVVFSPSAVASADHSLSINWKLVDEMARVEKPISQFDFDTTGRWSTLLVRIGTDMTGCSEVYLWLRNVTPERAATH